MATHCISINHPEIKTLVEVLKLPRIVIASKIAVWQQKTGDLDRFPTAEELTGTMIEESKEEKQLAVVETFVTKRIKRLKKELKNEKEGTSKYENIKSQLDYLTSKLEEGIASQDRNIFTELGKFHLERVDKFIQSLENEERQESDENLMFIINTLDAWTEFDETSTEAKLLYRRARPFIEDFTIKKVNENNTSGEDIDITQIKKNNKDIGTFRAWTGSLIDVPNYIASTIGLIIKKAQNTIETKNKQLKRTIEEEIKALEEYAKKNGVTLQQQYDKLIHYNESTNDIELIEDIDSLSPEESRFIRFYQETIVKLQNELPFNRGQYFIPNIRKKTLKSRLKGLSPVKERKYAEDTKSEELKLDLVPLEYLNKIEPSEKSTDLGAVLFEFGMFANKYEEMSNILPTVRILQEEIKNMEFVKSSNPNSTVKGEKSNIYYITDAFIEAQVKGATKLEQGKRKIKDLYDENGNLIGEKYIDGSGTLDNLLHYNSLLRIGFSPITATANVLFGDIANIIESIGGKFFSFGNLKNATNIFFKQTFDKDSVLNKLLEELNPLQELDDYEYIESLKAGNAAKKMSPEKLKEYAYSMQKTGEKFLQSRTMLAIMIKEGYLTKDGQLTEKYTKSTEQEKEQLSNKIQRLNQSIHGRYTTKEAAALQQNVIYRLVSQFRKWIPAAYESRFGEKQYDPRLQTEIEGRYRTLARLILNKKVLNNLIKMSKGELSETEMYNMRKNLIEITLLLATITLSFMGSGDDDKSKKLRKNAYFKSTMTLLNRVSGDLLFWYSPQQINNLGKNAIPLSKTIGDLIQASIIIPKVLYSGDYTFKSGSNKDKYRILKEIGDVVPLYRPIQDIGRVLGKNELEELR